MEFKKQPTIEVHFGKGNTQTLSLT